MGSNLIAIDLETTGLDPTQDRIIEIGAVKFDEHEIIGQWQTFVNPGRAIPTHITQLTGISNVQVAKAPSISAALPQLKKFVEDAPLVGHNVRFDLAFLHSSGFDTSNFIVDTYAVASAMLPSAPRYALSSIASYLHVPVIEAHRALNDASMVAAVYQELWRRSAQIPLNVLAEIVRNGNQMPWDGSLFFENAIRLRTKEVFRQSDLAFAEPDDEHRDGQVNMLANPAALHRSEKFRPLDTDALAALIEQQGPLATAMPDYEYRPQQVTMLREVAVALNQGQHIMIEGPTGVGKSLAYLIPSIYFAVQNSDRVVISTNTITLQEQLINKDIPLLRNLFNIPFRATVLKGRSNYLCPRRLAALRRRGPGSSDEMMMLARILIWQTENSSGDRGEITLRGPSEAAIWQRLSAEDEGCKMERCAAQMDGTCPFFQARQAAEGAHLVIVNHALLLSDVVTEGHTLPDYRYLIVDEAHHLEEATTSGLSFRTDPNAIRRQIGELGSADGGMLGEMLYKCREAIPPGYYDTLSEFVAIVAQASSYMLKHIDWFFAALQDFITSHVHLPRTEYAQQIRILPRLRQQPAWAQVQTHWENLHNFTSSISEAMTRLEEGLRELSEYDIEEYEDLLAGVGAAARHLTELHRRLNEIVSEPDTNTVYWVELSAGAERISIHAAPLDVGPLVEKHLWNSKDTIVLTSATLQTNGSFTYLQRQLNADHVRGIVIDSPFDYKSSTLLYLVNEIPEPAEQSAYQRAVERAVFDLCSATEGRALVLFTNYAQLRETASALDDRFAQLGITLYDQANGTSKGQMLEGFIQSDKAVLMGTRSFWEGVDVPGTDLSVLVIARLPFSVPSDPLFAARSEQFDDPFAQYSIPETILRFRQGFGRLIRRKTDRGVVVLLDRRILSKRYGKLFLDALPDCTVRVGGLAELPEAAVRWLSQGM